MNKTKEVLKYSNKMRSWNTINLRELKHPNKLMLWNTRGQFFLIAALVIVVILIGLGTLSIGTRISKEDVRIYDLTNEIDLEGRSVVDHGIVQNEDIPCLLYGEIGKIPDGGTEVCTEDGLLWYYSEANPDNKISIVYGDPSGYTRVESREVTIIDWGVVTGGGEIGEEITKTTITATSETPTDGTAEVTLGTGDTQQTLTFDLKQTGQSWYVVIVNEEPLTGERTVATNAEESGESGIYSKPGF